MARTSRHRGGRPLALPPHKPICGCGPTSKLLLESANHTGDHHVSDSGPSEAESSRPTDMLLAAYAAGTLSEPFAVPVASHLQMRAESRAGAHGQAHGAAIFRHARRPQPPAPSLDRAKESSLLRRMAEVRACAFGSDHRRNRGNEKVSCRPGIHSGERRWRPGFAPV
jgi:hypothetical protein